MTWRALSISPYLVAALAATAAACLTAAASASAAAWDQGLTPFYTSAQLQQLRGAQYGEMPVYQQFEGHTQLKSH